jgi:DNA replication ATP-dependent helicase Dna2
VRSGLRGSAPSTAPGYCSGQVSAESSEKPTSRTLLADLRAFVRDEQEAGQRKMLALWQRPLHEKLRTGWTQRFLRLEPGDEADTVWARLDDTESRSREGDLLVLHAGDPRASPLARFVTFEVEEEDRWLLRGEALRTVWHAYRGGTCFADPDAMDLTSYYEHALDDVATSDIGQNLILPLLAGETTPTFHDGELGDAERIARAEGHNPAQALAVGMAVAADSVACIQGPPGTGKTRVLALIARILVERGERLLVTSHTHMAINNALNKIVAQGVPVVKVGRESQRNGLANEILCVPALKAWAERPPRDQRRLVAERGDTEEKPAAGPDQRSPPDGLREHGDRAGRRRRVPARSREPLARGGPSRPDR